LSTGYIKHVNISCFRATVVSLEDFESRLNQVRLQECVLQLWLDSNISDGMGEFTHTPRFHRR